MKRSQNRENIVSSTWFNVTISTIIHYCVVHPESQNQTEKIAGFVLRILRGWPDLRTKHDHKISRIFSQNQDQTKEM